MTYRLISPETDAGKGYLRGSKPLEWALEYDEAVITSAELPRIIGWYPVAFQKFGQHFRFVMPFRAPGGEHTLINRLTGKWIGNVLPLEMRIFPFFASKVQGSDLPERLALTISEKVEQRFLQGSGNPVFDLDGQPTDYHNNLIATVKRRIARLKRDEVWITSLAELDLLVPWELNLGTKDMPLRRDDLYQIDEKRLNALDTTDAGSVLGAGGGRLVYGHIYSKVRANMPSVFQEKRLELERKAPPRCVQEEKALANDFFDFSDDSFELTQIFGDT